MRALSSELTKHHQLKIVLVRSPITLLAQAARSLQLRVTREEELLSYRRTQTTYAAHSGQPCYITDIVQVVITACLRTAFTKGGKGGFKDTHAADMLCGAFQSLIERSKIDPALIEDIAVGAVLSPGGGATEFRAAALAAGFPETAAVKSLNRQCSSGLQACIDIANAIKTGMIDVGIGAGVESMSLNYG